MKAAYFPFIASAIGFIMLIALTIGMSPDGDGATSLPLLTLLLMSEFALIVSAIGVYTSYKEMKRNGRSAPYIATTVLCTLLCVLFVVLGVKLWPL